MIQLSDRKKIIILAVVIFIVVISIIILLVIKNKESAVVPVANIQPTSSPVRAMTEDEKINVGISPTQEAEVVKDQDGLYIYRLKK